MIEPVLQFGDRNTADVILQLIRSDGTVYKRNPLYLHSQILGKSEYYKAMLSDRWSSKKRPLEVKSTICHSFQKYIKCIKLMYFSQSGKSLCFYSTDEVVSILPIASELLFQDCIQECMRYLDAVYWNPAQEAQLLDLFSSLQINTLPNINARLAMSRCKSHCEHLEMLEKFVPDMLFMVSNGEDYICDLPRSKVENLLVDYCNANASPAGAAKCKSELMKQFMVNLERIKSDDKAKMNNSCSALFWLVGVIQRCDGILFEEVLKIFCEDADLRNALTMNLATYSLGTIKDILDILINRILKGLGNGEIITPPPFRLSFLMNWVDTMMDLSSGLIGSVKYRESIARLDKGISDLADTLPFVEHSGIYNLWINAFITHSLQDHCTASKWWAHKLRDHVIVHYRESI